MKLDFTVSTITLPSSKEYVGTWGSCMVAHPHLPVIIMSLPSKAGRFPWILVNVQECEATKAHGLRGELRDGIMTDSTALCLTTYALCWLNLAPQPEVISCYRPVGLGKHQWRLLDFGDEMVGATGWGTNSVMLLRRADGQTIKRLRLTSPQATIRLSQSVVRCLSFHGGLPVDYDLGSIRPVAQKQLPFGTTPAITDSEIHVLTGPKTEIDRYTPIAKLWRIQPQRIVTLDRNTCSALRDRDIHADARDVLGVLEDQIIISTETGILVLAESDLAPVGKCDVSRTEVWQHTFVAAARAVVVLESRFVPTQLKVIRWSP